MRFFQLSAPEKKLLRGGRYRGATPWLIALMMFVMVIVAAAGLALANSSRVLSDAADHRYMVQLPGGAAQGDDIVKSLSQIPGTRRIEAVPTEEIRASLNRWLGASGAQANLPLPALVEVELADDVGADRLQDALRGDFPAAVVSSNRATIAPLLDSLRAVTALAAGLVILVAIAAGAAVVLATRAALAANRRTIEVLHGIGATDAQVTRLFQRRIAIDAVTGGVAGAAAAGVVLLLVAGGGLALAGQLAATRLLGLQDILVLAALPIVGAILAVIVAKRAVMTTLRETL